MGSVVVGSVAASFLCRGALDEAADESTRKETLLRYLFVLIPCVFGFASDRRSLNTENLNPINLRKVVVS